MSSTGFLRLSSRVSIRLLAGAILLSFAATVHADPKPLSKEEQAKVYKAIDKAILYLKRKQTEVGSWPTEGKNPWSLGQSLLVAYALLEAGVPPEDSVIKKAAAFSRAQLRKTNRTYELALGVLFLDRLGDPQDEPLLRSLALRLIAGQYPSGGWKYLCPGLTQDDEETLLRLLDEVNKLVERGEKPSAKWRKDKNIPHALQALTVFHFSGIIPSMDSIIRRKRKVSKEETTTYYNDGRTDNSNTQFAMLALWVARRHKIPLRPTLDLLALRFQYTQSVSGTWGYLYSPGSRDAIIHLGKFDDEWNSLTCVGLLGSAIVWDLKGTSSAEAYPDKTPADRRHHSTSNAKPLSHIKTTSRIKDKHVLKGLVYLYQCVGTPTSQMEARVPFPRGNYYFLWSLERVAMLYNLPTLADKEWYRWGAEILITNQNPNGSFSRDTWMRSATLSTAFALLFLKQSHPMKDLTPKLPFKPRELNESLTRFAPKHKVPDRSTVSPGQHRDLDRSITSPGQRRNPDR